MNHTDEDRDDFSIPEYSEMQKYAFVTKRALENNHIGYCYREYSDIKIDSGWRFLFGDEEDTYLDNPDNTETLDLKKVVEWKPIVSGILSARRETEFEWEEENNRFNQI